MVTEEDLSAESLSELIKKNKSNYPKHSLWVLVTGICSVARSFAHPGCHQCNFILRRLASKEEFGTLIEDIAEHLRLMISICNKMHMKIQQILESDGAFIIAPPIPLLVALEESFYNHPGLHRTCRLNYALCATSQTLQMLHVSYNMYCDVWTRNACKLMKSIFPSERFEIFNKTTQNKNIIPVKEIKQVPTNPKHKWTKLMADMMELAYATPFPSRIMKEKKMDIQEGGSFSRAVVIGNIKNTGNLKELTSAFPVSFVDADVDFDEDGIQVIKEEQEKWPSNTICIILTGLSSIAEASGSGPKCLRASCSDPLPVFVPKNHPEGDPDYQGKSDEEMANTFVDNAFNFAKNAIDFMKDGSALFLAPVMPLSAVWAGRQCKLSHDTVHRIVENKSLPTFGAGQTEWVKCAKSFEERWLHMTMGNLEPDSRVYTLYKTYLNEKPEILQYITDADDNSKDESFRSVWCQLVLDILKDFLYFHQGGEFGDDEEEEEEEEEKEDDLEINPSHYSYLLDEAESCKLTVKVFCLLQYN